MSICSLQLSAVRSVFWGFALHELVRAAPARALPLTRLNTYSHMFRDAQAKVANAMDKAFGFIGE